MRDVPVPSLQERAIIARWLLSRAIHAEELTDTDRLIQSAIDVLSGDP
jgi:hypothetical protein